MHYKFKAFLYIIDSVQSLKWQDWTIKAAVLSGGLCGPVLQRKTAYSTSS